MLHNCFFFYLMGKSEILLYCVDYLDCAYYDSFNDNDNSIYDFT